ncbi:MAG: hypothetical protein IKN65_00245 [Clostridia bacterium]|nr:hypothetical protein [Bacilli bacterium]MBR3672713.1 hypothetical protein [Clostridia bacterium]MBR4671587.1 hypothetical protein [Bacilli bacterium]
MFYKCKDCGEITDEPTKWKDYAEVGDGVECCGYCLMCPLCGGDVEEYEDEEELDEDFED